jgi:hypothetical protein
VAKKIPASEGPAGRSIRSPTTSEIGAKTTVPPESGTPPIAPAGNAPSPHSSAREGGDANVSMSPLDSIEAEKTSVKLEHMPTANTKRTSDEVEEALESLASVFTTSLRHVPNSFETGESRPERLALRRQPQSSKKSFGRRLVAEEARTTAATTSGAPSVDKETATPQIGDAPASRSGSPKPLSRVLASAVRSIAAASILAAGVGVSYVLWGSFGDQLEQAVMASVRNSATWLQHIRSSDWLTSPEAAATAEKIETSQQTEAAYVTNVRQNARKDEPTLPKVAHPTPEGSAPKPGNGSIESEVGSHFGGTQHIICNRASPKSDEAR